MIITVALTQICHAQTFVPYEPEIDLTLGASYGFADTTYTSELALSGLPMDSLRGSFAVEWVPTASIALDAVIFSSFDRYKGPLTGANPNVILAHGSQDDGQFHFNLTDLDLGLRYQAIDTNHFGLTPFLRARIPLTNYEVKGYAAAGTGLAEFSFGTFLGYLDFFVPGLTVEASYMYSLVQHENGGGAATQQYNLNRSDMSLRATYALFERLTLGIRGDLRWTHGGFNFNQWQTASQEEKIWHDPILQRRYVLLSLLGSFLISDHWSLGMSVGSVIWGENASNTKAISTFLTWTSYL